MSLKVEMAEPVVTSAPGMSAPPVPVAPVDSEVETVKTDALISEAPPAPPQTSQAPATLPDPLAVRLDLNKLHHYIVLLIL